MIFPTIRTLQRLARFANTNAAVLAALAHEQPLCTSCPAPAAGRQEARYMEGDAPSANWPWCPDGQIANPLDWQSERPVPLLKNVQRLTASNPGVMTGPGTNSYLADDPPHNKLRDRPGPLGPGNTKSACGAAAVGGDVRFIICTHLAP